jgi:hypothetical protein
MEFPGGWDELTAALNVADADEAWAFLLAQGLIRNDPKSRQAFEAAQQYALTQIDVTGPSQGYIIASHLMRAGLAPIRAIGPDPWGKLMKKRIAAWRISCRS